MRSERSANRSVAARTSPESRSDSWAMELSRGYRRRFGKRRDAVSVFGEAGRFACRARSGLDHAEQKEPAGRRRREQHRRLAAREIRGRFQNLLDALFTNVVGEIFDVPGRLMG